MPIQAPYSALDEILASIGEAGRRLLEIEASEGAAGNISVYLGRPVDLRQVPI
jgi:rhamnulose-1-phosphate aldolase